MPLIKLIKVTRGAYWVEIPEADLCILCGCPADSVKHMMWKGLIATTEKDGITCETGPNAILLSDMLIQNGKFSNLAEFPVLQMFYRQGMLLPNHPNNTGIKPLLIGSEEQVEIRNGVYVSRLNPNEYEFQYMEESVTVDLNLKSQEMYEAPYELGFHQENLAVWRGHFLPGSKPLCAKDGAPII